MQLTTEQRSWLERLAACADMATSGRMAIRTALADIDALRRDNDRLRAAVARLEAERDAIERRALRARAWEYDPGGRD